MNVLVTGAEGFIGGYLTKSLMADGFDVKPSSQFRGQIKNNIFEKTFFCDVRDEKQVNDLIAQTRPDVIYHLAAQSLPTASFMNPKYTFETNVIGTSNLFESVLKHNLDPVIIVACSSAEYGLVKEDEVPVKEEHSLKPLHPYGVSKVAQELITHQYHVSNGLKTVAARIFNTTGPGKQNDVVGDFSKRIVNAELNGAKQIIHGNLNVERDITDVRDMVNALKLCQKVDYGLAYNLCSQKTYHIFDLLQLMLSKSHADITAVEDPSLYRLTDEPIIMGDNTRFVKSTGWVPTFDIETTVGDSLQWFREVNL